MTEKEESFALEQKQRYKKNVSVESFIFLLVAGLIFFLIGRIIVVLGLAMILPLACSLIYKDGDTAAFGISIIICLVCGVLLVLANRRHRRQTMRRRDSFLFATLVWLSAAFFGALPFLFYGSFPSGAGGKPTPWHTAVALSQSLAGRRRYSADLCNPYSARR